MAEAAKRREWDGFFLDMAALVASRSKDPSTKVGAVIVAPDGKNVRSIGYNGFPRGMADDDSLYADREVKYSRIVHAEMNAILNAERRVDGCTLYCTLLPCDRCAVFVVQAGITRVVTPQPDADIESRWGESFNKTRDIFAEAGVVVVETKMDA